ncbi:MAG: hypothetical protein DDT29_00740 [Dehalococcoidia bacterium]|nr:hypothetical protein [Bacillota bacterium]
MTKVISVRLKRSLVLSVLSISIVLLGFSIVFARNIASYDLIVQPFNQTTFTEPLTKVSASSGVDNNTSIGGGYKHRTAIYRGLDRVTEQVVITSGSRVILGFLPGQNLPGTGYRLGHTSGLRTFVRVQALGTWSPDL